MKKILIVVGVILVLSLVSYWLFRDTPISEYDYSNCPPDHPYASCIGELTKSNWAGYLPPINTLTIFILSPIFLTCSIVALARRYKHYGIVKNIKKLTYVAVIVSVLILIGFLVPLGSYTTTYGCPLETTPTSRLHLIKGDSLDEVKNRKDPPGAGCTINTKYVLYFL